MTDGRTQNYLIKVPVYVLRKVWNHKYKIINCLSKLDRKENFYVVLKSFNASEGESLQVRLQACRVALQPGGETRATCLCGLMAPMVH